METLGAQPRTLIREAREQIRYLHEGFPESWSVPRLAEVLDVSTDVIRSVLKSKFVPTLEKTLKQDQKHSFEGDRTESSEYKHPEETEGRNKGVQSQEKKSFGPVSSAQGQHRELQKYSTSGGEDARGTDSDGLPSAKELAALKARELGEQNFSSKVVQRGQEFFDDNGNFLYRI
ncbi:hypothetical protein QTO34_014150 [Cnephaeus nilssonii]|uniref:Neugrin n=1 Tax=Cnephaeus nilssonii TaxID=3371016 RepID=A0AA40LBT8_CNENI|nr:hypothetical protein QTO34_014150 [Eptesicus nilssonii]